MVARFTSQYRRHIRVSETWFYCSDVHSMCARSFPTNLKCDNLKRPTANHCQLSCNPLFPRFGFPECSARGASPCIGSASAQRTISGWRQKWSARQSNLDIASAFSGAKSGRAAKLTQAFCRYNFSRPDKTNPGCDIRSVNRAGRKRAAGYSHCEQVDRDYRKRP